MLPAFVQLPQRRVMLQTVSLGVFLNAAGRDVGVEKLLNLRFVFFEVDDFSVNDVSPKPVAA